MAYDEGLAELMREDFSERPGMVEKKMFGGLCFMMDGNMACLAASDHAMYRVGTENEPDALRLDGVTPMLRTKRKMPGFVEVAPETVADDALRGQLLKMVLAYVGAMPAK